MWTPINAARLHILQMSQLINFSIKKKWIWELISDNLCFDIEIKLNCDGVRVFWFDCPIYIEGVKEDK